MAKLNANDGPVIDAPDLDGGDDWDIDNPAAIEAPDLTDARAPRQDNVELEADADLDAALAEGIDEATAVDGDKPATRARDEAGRFAKAAADKAAADAAAVDPAATPAEQQAKYWPDEFDAELAKLPPEQRAYVDKAKEHMLAAADSHYMPYIEAAKPYMAVLADPKVDGYIDRALFDLKRASPEQFGSMTKAQFVSNVLHSEYAMRFGDRAEGRARWLALGRDYGFLTDEADDPFADPREAHLSDRERDIQRRQSEIEYQNTRRSEQENAYRASRVDAELQSFATAKDANGEPLRPFFNEVRGRMGELLAARQARSMEEAYQLAAKPLEDALARKLASTAAGQQRRVSSVMQRVERSRPVRASAGPSTVADADLDSLLADAIAQAAA